MSKLLSSSNAIVTIDGDNIVYTEVKQTKVLPLKKFIEEVATVNTKITTPLLPKGCIKYVKDIDSEHFFVHLPMGKYTFKSQNSRGDRNSIKVCPVYMPHTIIKFSFKGSVMQRHRIGWSFDKEIDEAKSKWNMIRIPNIGKGSKDVCLGGSAGGNNAKQKIESFIKSYFLNVFNRDLHDGLNGFLIHEISDSQAQMEKDNIDEEDIVHRVFHSYDAENKKLIKHRFEGHYAKLSFADYFGV